MTITTNPMSPAQLVVELNPADLLIDLNIRDLKPDPDLVASIRDLGVLQPIVGYRTLGNAIRVRYGHRRTLAALEAGLPTVPVLVVADEAAPGGQADVDRILGQYAENKHREGLTVTDEAGVVAQLLDLGLTAGQVQKRTRMPKGAIAAAKALRASPIATETAAAHPELTLDQAAALAEFDQDTAAVTRLVQDAKYGDGQFRHTVQQLREQQAERQARAVAAAALQADGITVVEDRPGWETAVQVLRDADGQQITDEAHRTCPGNIAWLAEVWLASSDGGTTEWLPKFYCADPAANGHQPRDGAAAGGVDLKAQAADRSRVIKGNKAWRSAETVRRTWLAEFLARKEAPKNGLRYVIEAITPAHGDFHRSHAEAQQIARELLGLDIDIAQAVTVARASDARALVITLGLVLAATESEAANVMVWRTPTQASHIGLYFKALVGWGYTLSEIEQAVADAKKWELAGE